MQSTTGNKQRTKKIILTTVAVGAAGILGYFGWQYIKRKKGSGSTKLDELLKNATVPTATSIQVQEPVQPVTPKPIRKKSPAITAKKTTTKSPPLPLKHGSKGEKVKQLQDALIARYGKMILPKFGADGSFGTEMAAALKKLGLPAIINESTFKVLTAGQNNNAAALGMQLYNATIKRDFNKAITLLKKINGKQDYTAASEKYKMYRIKGVRQTLVNGLLNTFRSEAQQEQIKFEFLRIGLQYDGNKWNLSGIGDISIMTIIPTSVWINAKKCFRVPARMVLGNEISKRLGYTLFENRGKYFLVPTRDVQYL